MQEMTRSSIKQTTYTNKENLVLRTVEISTISPLLLIEKILFDIDFEIQERTKEGKRKSK